MPDGDPLPFPSCRFDHSVFLFTSVPDLVLQVINAARTLAARPHSKVARENMDVFKEAWEQQLQVLTEAVDDITGIEDFLATTGG